MTLATDGAADRRLHPLSWLFVLLAQLREFALPLIALLFFGSSGDGDWWESFGAIGAVLLALWSVLQYYTYRFRIEAGELVIRSGVLHRNVRHIPLAKIQNVALRRNVLHRMFGVAEVRLESAVGGSGSEAQMRVLSRADAAALEALVRASRDDRSAGPSATDDAPVAPLLTLSPRELVLLGLTSDRGLVITAAAAGAYSQFASPNAIGDLFGGLWGHVFDFLRDQHFGMGWVFALALLWLVATAVLRLLSVAFVLLRFYGFTLHEDHHRLSTEGGLLTRVGHHASRDKIQRWLVHESLLHRWLQRRSLRVETAAGHAVDDGRVLSDLVPIARNPHFDALLLHWLPHSGWPHLAWRPVHPQAWRRFATLPSVLTVIALGPLYWQLGASASIVLLLLPFWIWRGRRLAHHAGWIEADGLIGWRSGWLDRRVELIETDRVQAIALLQSPFDRRRGMASVAIDTAGADSMLGATVLRHLPEGDARALMERLAKVIAGRDLQETSAE